MRPGAADAAAGRQPADSSAAGQPRRSGSLPTTLQSLARDLGAGADRDAIVYVERGDLQGWSFARLSQQVERLAKGLAERGIGADHAVGICARNCPEWIVACLAVLRCGAALVPIDSQSEEGTFRYILRDSGLSLLFASSGVAERLRAVWQEAGIELFLLDDAAAGTRSWQSLLGAAASPFPVVEPGSRAVLFYTSGTTGPPKGVPLTHRNLLYQIGTLADGVLIGSDERILLPLPLHHVYPFVIGMLAPLALRLSLIMPSGFTGVQIIEALRRGRATMIMGVPRLYAGVLAGLESRLERQGRLRAGLFRVLLRSSTFLRRRTGLSLGKLLLKPLHQRIGPDLRSIVSGGAELEPELAWALEGLGWRVGTGYGLTETSPLLTFNAPGSLRLDNAGPAMPGVELRVDCGAVRGLADTRLGEILARGPGVFAGYHKLPDKTAEALSEDGWFRTGDLGYLDAAGCLHLAGRLSSMIVSEAGENIDPEKVEEAYQAHPAIAEIAVLERQHRPVGLIVPAATARRSKDVEGVIEAAVREVSRRLPSHHRLSGFVLTGETIPRTRLGKPRRHLLDERYERSLRGEPGRAVESQRPIALAEMAPEDRALLEDAAARAAWDLLSERFADRRLTPDSDLQLDLGIDSIDWLELTLAISERTGIALGEEAIGGMQLVRELLAEVAMGEKGRAAAAALLEDPEAALDERQRRWLAGQGALSRAAGRALFLLNRLILRSLFRLHCSGAERIPAAGPFLLVPNHASYLDPFALGASLDYDLLRSTFWAGWVGVLFEGPLRRLFARLVQAVPISPEGGAASSLAFGAAALRRGRVLVWFPEGQRSTDGALQPFKPGIGWLLERYPVPAVPVVIAGTYEAWPVRRRFPRLRPLRVRIGAPLDPEALSREGRGDTAAERITDALHERLRRMIEEG